MNLVGEPYNHYNMEVFLLEAKAVWEHTCIAGGLFLLSIQLKKETYKSLFKIKIISRGGENRTPTKGFGDPYHTTRPHPCKKDYSFKTAH